MDAQRLIELIATVTAILGGGGVWTYILSRRKFHAEADEIATKSAIVTMQATMETLRLRLTEVEKENDRLRNELNDERAESHAQIGSAIEKMNYFQTELQAVQKENMMLKEQMGRLGGREITGAQKAELALLRQEVEELRRENDKLRAEVNNLNRKFGTHPLRGMNER